MRPNYPLHRARSEACAETGCQSHGKPLDESVAAVGARLAHLVDLDGVSTDQPVGLDHRGVGRALRARLDTYLVRDDDRALFDLPPLNDTERARSDASFGTSAEHT